MRALCLKQRICYTTPFFVWRNYRHHGEGLVFGTKDSLHDSLFLFGQTILKSCGGHHINDISVCACLSRIAWKQAKRSKRHIKAKPYSLPNGETVHISIHVRAHRNVCHPKPLLPCDVANRHWGASDGHK